MGISFSSDQEKNLAFIRYLVGLQWLFCAGIGLVCMFGGSIEWAYYYQAPPFGIAPKISRSCRMQQRMVYFTGE